MSDWINIAPTRQFDYFSNVDGFWGQIFGVRSILSKVYRRDNLLGDDIVSDFVALIDPYGDFTTKSLQQKYDENVTNLYANHSPGFLLTPETRACIQSVFYDSARSYANKYLDENNTKLLLSGYE